MDQASSHRIKIGELRYVRLTPEHVIIEDDLRIKYAALTLQRFAKIVHSLPAIEDAVTKLKQNVELVNFRRHIGGPWHVSVTTGYHCVDIRQFFMIDEELKPTRIGMALRLSEWEQFKTAIDEIHRIRPDIAAVVPCYLQDDHNNQMGELSFICRLACFCKVDFVKRNSYVI